MSGKTVNTRTCTDLSEIRLQIDRAMAADRHRLRRQLRALETARQKGQPSDRQWERLQNDLQRSIELRERRRTELPTIAYDADLPIAARVDEIRAAIEDPRYPVVIVCGETGSGKSTQLPKICLAAGRGIDGMIGHTQPRRIAARAISARIAEELGSHVGRAVGFKIRFTDATQPETYIKLMTDGILLAETQGDRFLDQYDTIIIDEAHERSLNVDFLLGYIKRLLPRRRDLKLIITSATIDAERFSEHFRSPTTDEPAPIIEVSGRAYPVEIRYEPMETEGDEEERDLQEVVARTVGELCRSGPGDILVFLPTERDILETAKALRGQSVGGGAGPLEILPLYARLSAREQNRVFQPHSRRRVVLATNVAESSLTVPGIRFVIDTGTARISHYSPRRKVQRLPIEAIAQASADQRAGRCGRVGPGICVRLYAQDDYLARDRYTLPEIRRTNLASVILQTKALQLGELEDFPFLDPPRTDAVRDGYKTLFELGAIDDRQRLTDLGRKLARLPVDPRIGRMILAAADGGCLHEVLILAAVLEIQDPRERPHDKQQAADQAHARFADPASDFLALLKLWEFYHQVRKQLSRNQLRKACRQNFLSYNRMREWLDIHRQLKQLADEAGLKSAAVQDASGDPQRYAAIHRALLAGLLSNLALRGDGHDYAGAGGTRFHLWPGSGVFENKPKWVMAAELIETTRTFARTVTSIDPKWIEPLAGHLVKRTYSDPHWSRRAGAAMAYERVTLFGLIIVPRRRVPYGPIDPPASRELLIRHGLIEGECRIRVPFLRHNLQQLQQLEDLATRTRRSDLFVGQQWQFDFYDQRLPADVYDVASLERWLRSAGRDGGAVLQMRREDLLGDVAATEAVAEFPDQFALGPAALPLEYRFEPGNASDGITLVVPQAALNQLDAGRLGWLVPGLLEEKVLALIRSLPKSLRRNFVPAPDTARKVVGQLRFGEGPFLDAVARALGRVAGERVTVADFQPEKLPHHLNMNVRVVDDRGESLSTGRDLEQLQRDLQQEVAASFAEVRDSRWHRDDIVQWDWDELPEQVKYRRGGLELIGYPMLIDRGQDTALRLSDSPAQAVRQTRAGLRRLYCLAEKNDLRSQVAWLPGLAQWKLYAAGLIGSRQLEQQLAELIADQAFLDQQPLPRTAAAFQQRRLQGRERIPAAVQAITPRMRKLWESYHQARLALEHASSTRWQYALEDMRSQVGDLMVDRFLLSTPWQWLEHYARYFQAICARLEKLAAGGLARDRQGHEELAPFLQAYQRRAAEQAERNTFDPELEYFRWMLEEFRVSLFAQTLGTAIPVSARRLEKQWAKID
jgi:ATP-dependent helicase HrpA